MKFRKLAAVFVAGVLSLMTMSGCSTITIEGNEQQVQTEEVCRVGIYTPLCGDYLFTSAWGDCGADRDLRNLLHGAENVTVVKENTYAANTSVISSVTITEGDTGSRTYTYNLVDGLCFSDGSPLTAKDYVFSVLLQSSAAFGNLSGDSTAYEQLEGYEEYASGETAYFSGVHLLSDSSFSLTIAEEYLPDYQEMMLTQVYPAPMSVLLPGGELTDDGSGATVTGMTEEALAATLEGEGGYRRMPMVTAGPYMLESVEDGVYTLVANPYYAGGYYKRQPSITRMSIQTADMENGGEYDLIVGITARTGIQTANKLLGADQMSTEYYYDSLTVSSLGFNESVPTSVRQALSALIDPQQAADILAGNWGQGAVGNIPLASSLYQSCYASLSASGVASADAASLLEEANGGEPVQLTYGYDPEDEEEVAVLHLLEQAAEEQPLLDIVPMENTKDTDLYFQKTTGPKNWGAWQGLKGISMEESAAQLRHTGFDANSTRFSEKLADFEREYLVELPDLPLAVYRACDLVGKRLIGYQQVDVYDDWTVWIQYTRLFVPGSSEEAESE